MAIRMVCDVCGCTTDTNAVKDGVTSVDGRLVVHTKIMGNFASSADPVICPRCVRLAVYRGKEPVGDAETFHERVEEGVAWAKAN